MRLDRKTRIAIIGGGKMGEAIMGGWIGATAGPAVNITAANFVVANPGAPRRVYLEQNYGVACVADACQLDSADIVLLAVKPQVMMGVLESIASLPVYAGGLAGPLFMSVAAGLTSKRLEEVLPKGARLVRVMPNTPLFVGAGASTVCGGANATKEDISLTCDLFSCLGMSYVISEDEMDATSAVSGSGPAYVAAFVEALRDAGVSAGLKAELAESLAWQTVQGTARLALETGQNAQTVRVNVCSPGGSTLAGLAAMEEAGFTHSIDLGVAAAINRSKELGQC